MLRWPIPLHARTGAEHGDAESAELEPEPDDEEDGPPVVIDLVRQKMVRRRRALASGCVG
jgi:hypothetical protein